MIWFKYLLIAVIVFGVFVNLANVSKGEYSKRERPIVNAIAAVVNTLVAMGIWFWL